MLVIAFYENRTFAERCRTKAARREKCERANTVEVGEGKKVQESEGESESESGSESER